MLNVPAKDFWTGCHNNTSTSLKIDHVRRRIDYTKCPIHFEWICKCPSFESLTVDQLEYISCLNVLLDIFHSLEGNYQEAAHLTSHLCEPLLGHIGNGSMCRLSCQLEIDITVDQSWCIDFAHQLTELPQSSQSIQVSLFNGWEIIDMGPTDHVSNLPNIVKDHDLIV